MRAKPNRFVGWLLPWLYLTVLILIAEVVVRAAGIPEYFLPAPSQIFREIAEKSSLILHHLKYTMSEALLGFAVGNFFAVLFAFMFSQWRPMRQGLYPIFVAMQAVPLVAVAPFVLIWFGPGILGKAVMSAMICYFPATVIATDGFSRVNREALALLRSLGASRWLIFRHLGFPSSVPGIMSALEVSATLCTIGAIVAELAGADRGVGYLILMASYEFKTVTLFATLVVTSSATFLLFKIVQVVGSRVARKFTFSYAAPVE